VFCYVGSVFAPALDEGVGGLWTVCIVLFCFVGLRGRLWADGVCSVLNRGRSWWWGMRFRRLLGRYGEGEDVFN
jgi:hypothetical protein